MKPSTEHNAYNVTLDLPIECQPIPLSERDIVKAFSDRGGVWWDDDVRLCAECIDSGFELFSAYVNSLKAAIPVMPAQAPDIQLTELADDHVELEIAGTVAYVFSLTKKDATVRFYLVFKTPKNTWCVGLPNFRRPAKSMARVLADVAATVVELVNKDR